MTALSGEGGTPAAGETVTEVSTAADLTAAITGSSVNTVKLTANIDISNTLTVNRIVKLDLNGYVLQMTGSGSVIKVEGGGNLTLTDSNPAAEHKFMPGTNGLWVLNEASGTEIVTGGVITGGTGYPYQLYSTVNCGGGVYIAPGGQLTMTGGNIIGCSAGVRRRCMYLSEARRRTGAVLCVRRQHHRQLRGVRRRCLCFRQVPNVR